MSDPIASLPVGPIRRANFRFPAIVRPSSRKEHPPGACRRDQAAPVEETGKIHRTWPPNECCPPPPSAVPKAVPTRHLRAETPRRVSDMLEPLVGGPAGAERGHMTHSPEKGTAHDAPTC